jgi:hypothetical protein
MGGLAPCASLGWLVIASVLMCPASASAGEWIQPRLSLGPGTSLAGQLLDFEFVGEGTFSVTPFGPHLSLGHLRRDGAGYTYGEIAAWFILTVGVGAGRAANDAVASHVFVGLPVPVASFDFTADGLFAMWGTPGHGGMPRFQVYVEPAYRRFLRPRPGGQLEVLLKASMGFGSPWQ